jgi:hypothetical protein
MTEEQQKKDRELKSLCDCEETYCFLRELLVHDAKYTRRLTTQMKLVEKLKYKQSEAVGYDIAWKGAMQIWVDDGYAKLFADAYTAEISIEALEKILFK